MTEKEFLKAFIKYGDIVGVDPYEDVEPEDTEVTNDRIIDEFLEEHHKEYFETKFYKKTEEEYVNAIKAAHSCQCSICDPYP